MASVQDSVECPNCKTEDSLTTDYNCRTGEEWGACNECGYTFHDRFKRDEEGDFVLQNPEGTSTFDNLIPEHFKIENPFGAYRIDFPIGSQCGTLETENDYDKFVSEIVSFTNQPHEINEVVVSRLIDGEIVKENIYQNPNPIIHEAPNFDDVNPTPSDGVDDPF
jgi:Zn ribbon nucleic-acid-binding protein